MDYKLPIKRVWSRFCNSFLAPILSFIWVKLGTSNFVRRLILMNAVACVKNDFDQYFVLYLEFFVFYKQPQKGAWSRSRDPF